MNTQDIRLFAIMGVVILIGAVLVMLPKSDPVTAQSNPTTFEECLEIYPEHYCLELFPPTATPTPAPPTNTPTPTATSTPRPNPTTFEECLEIYPEHYCLDLFPPTATPTPAPPTNTPTPTATPTPRPNPTTFEECLEIYPEHYCNELFATPTPTPTDTVVPTPTDTVVPTPTDTVVPTPTDTVVPTPTDTVVPTPTDTVVPTPTDTPTHTPTPIDTPTHTPTPTPPPTAPPPDIQWLAATHVDAVTVRWDPPDNITQIRVRYKDRDDESDTWVSETVSKPFPDRYEIDGLWDCEVTYKFEIASRGNNTVYSSEWGTPFEDTESTICMAKHRHGHQADHTVRWTRGTFPSENNDPPHEDVYNIWNAGVGPAASGWDKTVGNTCEECDDEAAPVVTVRKGHKDECAENSFACLLGSTSLPDGHLDELDLEIVLEHIGEDHSLRRVIWTDKPHLDGHIVRNMVPISVYYYFLGTAMHEFGHAFGLRHPEDIDITFRQYPSVMYIEAGTVGLSSKTVSSHDVRYMRSTYYGHTAHELD